ncbi:unnamed protein product [Paramecium pentaurelia]|uniref:Uncharacterized protein n=1 Tax=Paramecium pentaurelia TaxID=43138 RepID=A0A8S1UDL5_9CILI|nr:unnamed protein product [Paramecium pentaurelia]
MQEVYTYQILKKCNGKAVIQIDEELLGVINAHLTMKPLQKQREVPYTLKKLHNFQRRIVPFFMNQFMHWSEEMGYKQVDGYLRAIHKKKTSKQQKFELGDLKKLFGVINPRTKIIQIETQNKWIDFLSTQADICVLLNNKIKDQSTKQLYIQAIQNLKDELKKELPYDKFLSIPKKEESVESILEESKEQIINEEFSSGEVDEYSPTDKVDPYSYLSCAYSNFD